MQNIKWNEATQSFELVEVPQDEEQQVIQLALQMHEARQAAARKPYPKHKYKLSTPTSVKARLWVPFDLPSEYREVEADALRDLVARNNGVAGKTTIMEDDFYICSMIFYRIQIKCEFKTEQEAESFITYMTLMR